MFETLLLLVECSAILTIITLCILNLCLIVCSVMELFCVTDVSIPMAILTSALEMTPMSLIHTADPDPLSIIAKINKTLHKCLNKA